MSLLAWPALLLLLAVPILVLLTLRSPRPREIAVGSLLLWQRVRGVVPPPITRRRKFEPLLWLLLAAALAGAFGAARPALAQTQPRERVAVFIEALGGANPGLAELRARAEAECPEAELTFWMPGPPSAELATETLAAGTLESELAQFQTRSTDADGHLLFLCAPQPGADRIGRVLPRLNAKRTSVVYELWSEGELVFARASGEAPEVEGAQWLRSVDGLHEYRGTSPTVTLKDREGTTRNLTRRGLHIGVGEDWTGRQHKALLAALLPDPGEPALWLGAWEQRPALRILRGEPANLDQAEFAWVPDHALFRELPMANFDWRASGRVLAPEAGYRSLLTASVGGEPLGDIVRLSPDGKVLEFAGDPFSEAPVEAAALLLDNAIGVLTGARPSSAPRYEPLEAAPMPSRRAAFAAPFAPSGTWKSARATPQPREISHWLLLVAGIAAAAAGVVGMRKGAAA
jgi:hypothetical protein